MKVAIISDIHGNLDAFGQVLNDIEASGIDAVVCLGDNVGYGPEPEQVIRQVRERNIPCVMGNHERAVLDGEYLNWFNPAARRSLQQTKTLLSEESFNYIRGMKSSLVIHESRFVHGFPPDSMNIYLFQVSKDTLEQTFGEMKERLCFVGHTHELKLIGFDDKISQYISLGKGTVPLHKGRKYIVNVGSVGQPRDRNNNAKYVIWNTSKDSLEVRFVPYDIAAVVSKIMAAGLPKVHADRLW
ncbi:MAG: metallophosphatase family protein [Deltaproteobacteria bacterium]|nr:metallophosphatase family protein [Deltaproteobacteria bacterium]MBW1957196.1 metallophosphatase family protein [Deltaproteobacteria bacterium]MBW2013414.1 metallophosphatase family protein [Deltaproteobacteria bacterium]MBW2088385.1 metallophosphatase family protein [Deltaproteobacteria bacterium]MBW2320696.1 metallophosphatase family protein [Deltaproteobacteria bacterium]